jgi:DNA-3-methyladenine glycosylase II
MGTKCLLEKALFRRLNLKPTISPIFNSTFDDAAVLKALSKRDPKLRPLFKKIGAFKLHADAAKKNVEGGPYHWLFRSIIYQQLHGKAAAAILSRVRELFGGKTPRPEDFLVMQDAPLRAAGLSGNKLAALRDLSRAAVAGKVPTLREAKKMSDEELIERLIPIRGIGRWTVEMFLIFGLRRADVLAVDDFALKKACLIVHGLEAPPNKKQFIEIGESWKPWRSLVCWYLWRSLD